MNEGVAETWDSIQIRNRDVNCIEKILISLDLVRLSFHVVLNLIENVFNRCKHRTIRWSRKRKMTSAGDFGLHLIRQVRIEIVVH